jgi:S1-C subfamily serine protease
MADVVERLAPSVVRVDDGSRLTATGIIWSTDGVIVATAHGVERDEELTVERADGSRHAATLVGRDPDVDLAVLRAEGAGWAAAAKASPDAVKVGQLVLALGRPGRMGLQASIGIISARQDTESKSGLGYLLHTDAALHPGFSGGPLVNMAGQVVGLVNRMYGRGAGMAVGTPILQHVVDALLAHGRIRRGYLGIRTQPVALPAALRQRLQITQEHALLIVQVEESTPAETAGLLIGDTLLAIDGQPVGDGDSLRHHLRRSQAGQTIILQLIRGGERRDVTATLGAAD